jgi:hypothetical protein
VGAYLARLGNLAAGLLDSVSGSVEFGLQIKDRQADKGDGKKLGRVRLAECSMGPDCDEAGMF